MFKTRENIQNIHHIQKILDLIPGWIVFQTNTAGNNKQFKRNSPEVDFRVSYLCDSTLIVYALKPHINAYAN